MQRIPFKNSFVPSAPTTPTAARSAHTDFDRLVQQFFAAPWPGDSATRATGFGSAIDVTETDAEVLLRAELPGVDPDQVEITLHEGVLTIAGEKKDESRAENEAWRIRERRFGSFRRSFELPTAVDESSVSAEHKHGVVTVRLPKMSPVKPRKIDIKAS